MRFWYGYFQYAVISSILHDEPQKKQLLSVFEDKLQRFGGELHTLESNMIHPRNSELPLFMLVLTGGTESEAMSLISRERMLDLRMPIVLLAHPSHNSLPLVSRFLQRLNKRVGKG